MNIRIASILLSAGLLTQATVAQGLSVGTPPASPPPATGPTAIPGKTQVFAPNPAGTPKYDSLAKKGADGKYIQLTGIVDCRALINNPQVDATTREKTREVIEDWAADVNQLAIDNLDFLEKIDNDGLIDNLDFNDTNQVRYMSQITVPFASTGPLTSRLQAKGVLTAEQASLNSTIVNDYLQTMFTEILGNGGVVPDPLRVDDSPETQKEKIERVNKLTHFIYYIACRDARESYHQIMIDSAPKAGEIVKAVAPDAVSKAGADIAAAQGAKTDADRQAKVAKLLKDLSFDQRRAYLQKAMDAGANKNPLLVVERQAGVNF